MCQDRLGMLFGFGLDCGEVIGIDSESYMMWNQRNRDFEKYELWEIGNARTRRRNLPSIEPQMPSAGRAPAGHSSRTESSLNLQIITFVLYR